MSKAKINEIISEKLKIVEKIKATNLERLIESRKELQEVMIEQTRQKHQKKPRQESPKQVKIEARSTRAVSMHQGTTSENKGKNVGVSDTDKMIFDKKFKNYLNHKQQFLEKAKQRRERIMDKRRKERDGKGIAANEEDQYFNQEEVLSNCDDDYQYRNAEDMLAAYDQMVNGKKRKGGRQLQLFHCELFENHFRAKEFAYLLDSSEQAANGLISKDTFLNYLFDEPCIMMLYSINPYLLGDELSEFQTSQQGWLNYLEFSVFLLTDREPTYFQYQKQNIEEARKIGRGIKCAPIIAKWIDQSGIFQFLIDLYKQIDMLGNGRIDRSFLARKIRKEAESKRIMEVEVIEIVNINKRLPLNRLIYEIEFQMRGDDENEWTFEQFQNFLKEYHRLDTPDKDKLITKLILSGKYDNSYVYIVSQEVLQILKDVFDSLPKFAEFFVVKAKFIQKLSKDPRYQKIRDMNVRSQSNRYVQKQSVEQTLIRLYAEGDTYIDIEEVLDFFTNRGRPKIVEYQVYLANLERQLALLDEEERLKLEKDGADSTTSSDEEFSNLVREKRINRKKQKLKAIRNSNTFNPQKKFNVTIPIPYDFDLRGKNKKISIREARVKEMVDQKRRKQDEAMKPIKVKQVPAHVKENLYERLIKDQERERQERLQRFRLQIMSSIKVSDRLIKPKSTQIHCGFGGQPYKFVARPMPWYCEVNLLDRINQEKQERRERILQELINRHGDFDLPQGVKRMIERQEELKEKRRQQISDTTGSVGECTFNPQITRKVPDFATIHEHLHFDLENAKQAKAPIFLASFSFQNRPARSRTTHEGKKPIDDKKKHMQSKNEYYPQQDLQNIPKTMKFDALVELRRKQKQQNFRKIQEQKRSEAIRKMRKDKFAPVVRSVLRKHDQSDPSRSRAIIQEKLRQFRKEEKKKKAEYQQQMIKIYTKVFNRPLLVQTIGKDNQDVKGTRYSRQTHHDQPKRSRDLNNNEYLQNDLRRQENPQANQRQKYDEYDQMRRKAIAEHHPGQYAQDEEGMENEGDEDEFDQEYLSDNGHYTN